MSSLTRLQTPVRVLLGLAAILFGLATLASGGRVLFGDGRASAGQVVEFVLLFNFSAGFIYITTGVATLLKRPWAVLLARGLAAATLLTFVALGLHIATGGGFESHTVMAMTLRSGFWLVQAFALSALLGAR